MKLVIILIVASIAVSSADRDFSHITAGRPSNHPIAGGLAQTFGGSSGGGRFQQTRPQTVPGRIRQGRDIHRHKQTKPLRRPGHGQVLPAHTGSQGSGYNVPPHLRPQYQDGHSRFTREAAQHRQLRPASRRPQVVPGGPVNFQTHPARDNNGPKVSPPRITREASRFEEHRHSPVVVRFQNKEGHTKPLQKPPHLQPQIEEKPSELAVPLPIQSTPHNNRGNQPPSRIPGGPKTPPHQIIQVEENSRSPVVSPPRNPQTKPANRPSQKQTKPAKRPPQEFQTLPALLLPS